VGKNDQNGNREKYRFKPSKTKNGKKKKGGTGAKSTEKVWEKVPPMPAVPEKRSPP